MTYTLTFLGPLFGLQGQETDHHTRQLLYISVSAGFTRFPFPFDPQPSPPDPQSIVVVCAQVMCVHL